MNAALHESHPHVARFLQQRTGSASRDMTVRMRPLCGGLVSAAVVHVSTRYRDASGRRRTVSFVLKELGPEGTREADVHAAVRTTDAGTFAPELLFVERDAHGARLYLEAIAPASSWPWRDLRHAGRVLERLADLHAAKRHPELELHATSWNYESELLDSARLTLHAAERTAEQLRDARIRASLPALRRVVAELEVIRRELVADGPLPAAVLHGDVHSGNVLVRRHRGEREPVLLDWGRLRIGSPFEDVSSWLQSLGFWEPEVRRKHDTLLGMYLAARNLAPSPSDAVRDAYWLAAASNGLAGALHHQLAVATNSARPGRERDLALHVAHDWLRVIRRADARRRARH